MACRRVYYEEFGDVRAAIVMEEALAWLEKAEA